jgi:DNA repair exonuclease SbcCD ATPase subunit
MIKGIGVENFLPFREYTYFPLANQGLVLIRGNNRVSASSNDNGSGKTSVLHAIAWVLFGEDLKGRKADAVACRFTEGQCSVRIDLEDDLGAWSVIRTRRPASLRVEGLDVPPDSNMDVVQAAIESRLGFGMHTFRNAVVFGQGSFDRFAHADQAEQMKMLDEIQGLDYSEPRRNAADWRKNLVATMGEIESGVSDDSMVLEETKNQIKTLTDIRNQFEVRQFERLKLSKAKTTGIAGSIATLRADIREIGIDAKILERARFEESKLIECEAALSLTRQAEDEAGALQDEAGTNLRRHDEKLERLLKHSECPECLSVIEGAWSLVRDRFAIQRKPLALQSDLAAKEYRKCLGASAAALEAVEAQQAVLRAIVGGTEDLSRMIMRLEEKTTPARRKRLADDLARLEAEAAKAEAEWRRIKDEKWDGSEALARASEKVTLLTARIARERGRMDKAAIAVDLAEYCVDAFSDRGIRSLMVDNVADFVNDRMVEHLEALTAGEATNRMAATTPLKKGGTKERISFTPTWAWGGEGPDSGSGGQDRRVDLATFAAVQDLSESRSARPFPLKAYDEPFDALDSRGKEMACAWLRAQAKTRTVLLITHSEELAGLANPDVTWTIVYDENGATVQFT